MHPTEVNEPFEQPDDSDYSLIYDEEDSGIEALSAAAEIEALGAGKSKITDQSSEQSIACYGAPEDDTSVEFLDRRYALEDEITLENGEKVRLQLTDEQKLRREVIRNLAEVRYNRKLFSQSLKEGAEKLDLSTEQVRRIFKNWIASGAASLVKAERADCKQPRRSEYWYDLSLKIYKDANKGSGSLTRTQAADRVQDQIYEYVKLELPVRDCKVGRSWLFWRGARSRTIEADQTATRDLQPAKESTTSGDFRTQN
jgi:putative transposase